LQLIALQLYHPPKYLQYWKHGTGVVSLKILGNACGTTHSGELLVKVENLPSLHEKVYDRRKNEVGKVVYIFGNVRSPYAVVRLFHKNSLLQMMGKEAYLR